MGYIWIIRLVGGLAVVAFLGLLVERLNGLPFASKALMEVENRSQVLQRIQAAGELTTFKYTLTTEIPVTQPRQFFWGAFEVNSSLLYLAEGTVKAGVDVSQARQTAEGIELPAPQVLDVVLDVERSKTYSADRGFLNLGPEVLGLREAAEAEAVMKLRQAACGSGILERSRQQATVVLAQLTGLNPTQIKIASGKC